MSARSAHANPCARGRMMVVAPAVATTMVWGTPWLGSILIESQTRLIESQTPVLRPRPSGALLKRFCDLGLEWLNGIVRRFLGKGRELLCLFGKRLELLAHMRG